MTEAVAWPVTLAIDTSTPVVSVALHKGERSTVRTVAAGRRTGSLLPQAVAEVCAEALVAPAAVELVAVGVGPGPYTSLRAGIMFARTTGFAVAAPVVGACSLDVVARKLCGEASFASDVVIATDARRREVYWARYTADGRRLVGPRVGTPDAVQAEHVDAVWIGPDQAQPDAATLAQWAAFDAAAGQARPVADDRAWDDARADGAAAGVIAQTLLAPHPLYLRRPDVHLPSRAT